jgi:hypothetical protein
LNPTVDQADAFWSCSTTRAKKPLLENTLNPIKTEEMIRIRAELDHVQRWCGDDEDGDGGDDDENDAISCDRRRLSQESVETEHRRRRSSLRASADGFPVGNSGR